MTARHCLPLLLLLFVGCGRDSSRGETCSRTDDCAEPLRCVQFVCVDPVPPGMGVAAHPGAAQPVRPSSNGGAGQLADPNQVPQKK